MITAALLGTGGTTLTPTRDLTSLLIKFKSLTFLVDVGEGVQRSINKTNVSTTFNIDMILFTHGHIDHWGGLIPLISTCYSLGRTKPLVIVCPEEVAKVVYFIKESLPSLSFPIKCVVLSSEEEKIVVDDITITAFKVDHSMLTYGYTFEAKKVGQFNQQKADESGFPPYVWSLLQEGGTIRDGLFEVDRECIFGDDRKGIKLTYCTDTRPCAMLSKHAKNSDLLICEGMYYGTEEDLELAIVNKHMTMLEAVEIAKTSEVKELWITHLSPKIESITEYREKLKELFSNVFIPRDIVETIIEFEYIQIDQKIKSGEVDKDGKAILNKTLSKTWLSYGDKAYYESDQDKSGQTKESSPRVDVNRQNESGKRYSTSSYPRPSSKNRSYGNRVQSNKSDS